DWSHPLQTLMNLFSQADPFLCLLWATLISTLVAFIVHLGALGEKFSFVNRDWFNGCHGMFTVCVILVLAWSIGAVCKRLDTGAYVASLLGDDFNPAHLPLLTFVFAAAISFATGTSFGTMSILMPIVLPIALQLGAGHNDIIYGVVGSVLGGSIFGDHCSPLSDTTILSSGASGCSVTAHVNTQLPYAALVGLTSFLCLFFFSIFQINAIYLLLIAILFLFSLLFIVGRTTPKNPSESVDS
ncbi:MAG: Na+/H+ antiporter NhaC family protein, partial [Candidatus Hinthialibacter sp.]